MKPWPYVSHVAALPFHPISGGVTAARGFLAGGVWSGIKRGQRKDLALIYSTVPARVAAVYTRNRVQAAPVLVTRQRVRRGIARAILINSGCANCLTGAPGLQDARTLAHAGAQRLGISDEEMLVASTGVIGRRLPVARIQRALPTLVRRLRRGGHHDAAEAILTTDRVAKSVAFEDTIGGARVRVGGIAKGSGMINPSMATMLCFITTDVAIAPALLRRGLRAANARSFNAITVDGDMSTNDMVVVLANGQAENRPITAAGADYQRWQTMLEAVCVHLARWIVQDGEGATKLAEIAVRGARNERDAWACARQIANSSLVKTMLAGADVNLGRIAAAAGASGAQLDPGRLDILLNGHAIFRRGAPTRFDRATAVRLLKQPEATFTVDLHAGTAQARVWTCDLTAEYVRINASYTT